MSKMATVTKLDGKVVVGFGDREVTLTTDDPDPFGPPTEELELWTALADALDAIYDYGDDDV